MESREIVRKAIEFDTPPRLPFFLGGHGAISYLQW